MTVAKLKGAFRLAALDGRAAALGLKPGMALADARAMRQDLDVHDADPDADAATLAALVDWCRLFTPLAAPDGLMPDGQAGAILDITGAAHLFGGEAALMDTMVARLAAQGFAAAAAIAATPGAAWALARHGVESSSRRARLQHDVLRQHDVSHRRTPLLEETLEPAQYAKFFAPMPLAALRLDDVTIARLAQAGLRRIGDLLLRPRAPIVARFGTAVHDNLDALLGLTKTPISPRFEAPAFIAERRFAEGIARREDVEGTILALAYDLCGLLARHGEGARVLDVGLFRVDGLVRHITAGASRPLRDPFAMARLFRERIEAAGEDGLDTGYGFEMVRLSARVAERLDEAQPGWDDGVDLSADSNADLSADLADLVDRLGARFGLARVTRLACVDTHRPERAAGAIPARIMPSKKTRPRDVTDDRDDASALPDRPIRLFERPEPIDTIAAVPDGPPLRFRWRRVTHQVAAIEGPERIGPDWWQGQAEQGHLEQRHLERGGLEQGQAEQGHGSRTRDYFRAEDTDGRRFWLYREGLYRDTAEPRWFLHGLFA